MELNKIYCEDCLDTMNKMPDGFIDLTVTSPPYDNLRDYQGYSFSFENIALELFRVTKNGGVVVWIVGDATIKGSETGTSFKQALYFKECGFRLHDTMIYSKPPAYPPSNNSIRYGQAFEYMFVLSKGKPKTVNLIIDRENKWGGYKTFGERSERRKDGSLVKRTQGVIKPISARWNIWDYTAGKNNSTRDNITRGHPAIFPEKLARDHIVTWSNPDDIIYDPMVGSGTTAKIAHLLKRNWIGSEISQEYIDLANARLSRYLNTLL